MKKVFIMIAGMAVMAFSASAQELTEAQKAAAAAAEAISNAPKTDVPLAVKPKYWKNSLTTKIDFGQTSLTNWAAGGYNSYSLKGFIDANANYAKDNLSWTNRLQLDYGFLYSADKPVLQKSDDRIYLESKFGYKAIDKLFISAEYSFKSQFTDTYEYPKSLEIPEGVDENDNKAMGNLWKSKRTLKSGLLSPANTSLALGLDYKPFKWLSVNLAPLTGGFVIVNLPELRTSYKMNLRDENNAPDTDALKAEYTNPEGVFDDKGYAKALGGYYRPVKFEFGAQLKVDIAVNVNDNFKYTSQILAFYDYIDKTKRDNIRLNWDNRIEWKLAKYFSDVHHQPYL